MRFKSRTTQNLFCIGVIIKHEFIYNLLSWRMAVILILFTFGTLAGAYGLSYIIVNEFQDAVNLKFLQSPEDVLGGMSAFISYLGSLMAIVFGFDSITREKTQGTMDFLLTRPVTKRGIIVGKFFGLFFALMLPISLVALCSVGMITYMVGAPAWDVTLAYLFLTACFIGTFISFQQIFSSLARSVMEALVTGIMIYLLYTMFWMIFPYGFAYILGIDVSNPSVALDTVVDVFNLFYPNGAYQSALSGFVDHGYIHGMPWWAPAVAVVVWFVVTLLINIEVFNRKA